MATKTWVDPVVEEVRAWRRELFAEADYDLERLVARLMESQKRHGNRLVRQPTASLETGHD